MLMRHMGSLGRMRLGGMGLLIRLEVGLGVVINGGIGGVTGLSGSTLWAVDGLPGCSRTVDNRRQYQSSPRIMFDSGRRLPTPRPNTIFPEPTQNRSR
jgi:hypothetical protein